MSSKHFIKFAPLSVVTPITDMSCFNNSSQIDSIINLIFFAVGLSILICVKCLKRPGWYPTNFDSSL